MTQLCRFRGTLTKGVAVISFTQSGDKLAAVSIDPKHTIVIYDITTKSKNGGVLLHQLQGGTEVIFDLRWKNDSVNNFKNKIINFRSLLQLE